MPIRSEHEGISFTGLLPGYSGKREDFEDAENSLFRFCRGFLLCRERGLEINSHFTERAFAGGYALYIHDMLAVDAAADEETGVWVLGVAYFTSEEYEGADESESAVLKRALEDSEENFYRALDHLAGRYAVLARRGEKLFAVNDPCGLKTVYYSPKAECVGSHLALVNLAARAGLSEIETLSRREGYRYSYAYPGNSTCYEGIFLMIPNFSLSLGDYSVKRFFPRETLIKTDDIYAVRCRFLEAMRFSMRRLLKKGKKICMSLTGGRDSKVCFYATREYKDDIFYFT